MDNTRDSFLTSWEEISWKDVNKEVLKIKRRIWKYAKNKNYKALRNYQKLMVHSSSNVLYSIRRITQTNSGSKTPGYDETTYSTPTERLELFKEIKNLNLSEYNPLPVKRIYVPKPDGRQRPLGIPSLLDRVIQQMIKNALEPEWEAYFEPSSYGFRPSRSVNDACNRLFVIFNSPNSREWIVDADITGCFDNINHNYLIDLLKHFPYQEIIKKWLEGGIIYDHIYFETADFGTPQGSIISPVLANIALHGMEAELGVKLVNKEKHYVKTGSRSFVRYADDFVVMCYSKEDAEKVITELGGILEKRGLQLSEAKTKIVHITEGFDFLGFNFKRSPYDGFNRNKVFVPYSEGPKINYEKSMIIIKPSEKSINTFKSKVKECFSKYHGNKAGFLIKELNSIIRGWANSKLHWHCNRTFHSLDSYLFDLTVRWMKRQHPNKSWGWLKTNYFYHKIEGRVNNKWVFHAYIFDKNGNKLNMDLLQLKWFPHTDWVMLAHNRSPFNIADKEHFDYLIARRELNKPITLLRGFDKQLAEKQKHICPVCNESIWNGEKLHKHHIVSRKEGGKDTPSNLIILHLICHQTVHYGNNKRKWLETFIKIKQNRQ